MIDFSQVRGLLAPLESAGGVSDEAIQAAEKKLKIRFPPSYRAFLAEYGNVRGTPYEIAGLSSEIVHDDEPPYWWNVVDCNDNIRRASKGLIPNAYLLISDDGCDYKFYLDTSRPDPQGECPVIALGPGVDGVIVADSFLDFIRRNINGSILF